MTDPVEEMYKAREKVEALEAEVEKLTAALLEIQENGCCAALQHGDGHDESKCIAFSALR